MLPPALPWCCGSFLTGGVCGTDAWHRAEVSLQVLQQPRPRPVQTQCLPAYSTAALASAQRLQCPPSQHHSDPDWPFNQRWEQPLFTKTVTFHPLNTFYFTLCVSQMLPPQRRSTLLSLLFFFVSSSAASWLWATTSITRTWCKGWFITRKWDFCIPCAELLSVLEFWSLSVSDELQ